jgi:hypothetical protein
MIASDFNDLKSYHTFLTYLGDRIKNTSGYEARLLQSACSAAQKLQDKKSSYYQFLPLAVIYLTERHKPGCGHGLQSFCRSCGVTDWEPLLPEQQFGIKPAASSPLVSFLYELMRDHLPVGQAEKIVCNIEQENKAGGVVTFCNKHLAEYAAELAKRLA